VPFTGIPITSGRDFPLGAHQRVVAMDDPVAPKHYEIEVTASKVR